MESGKKYGNILDENWHNHKRVKPFLSRCYKKKFYIYYNHPVTGKRTKLSTKTKVRTEAEIILRRFLLQNGIDKTSICSTANKKISDLWELLYQSKSNILAASSISLYKLAFNHFIRIIGDRPISSITRFECDKYINDLNDGRGKDSNIKRKKSTINIYFRNMRAAFNLAVEYGLISINPFKSIKELAIPDNTRPRITFEELKTLFKIIDNELIMRIAKFAILTGMRLGEITHLQWEDIDFINKIINIKNKTFHSTKTRKDRKIPLTDQIYNIIIVPQSGKIHELKAKEHYVFGKENGVRYSKGYISHKFKEYVRKAGINDKICFHCNRHTTGTILAKSNIPLRLLQSLLGHSSQATTALYMHTDVEDLRYYLDKIDFGININ